MKILIIDDMASARNMLFRILKEFQYIEEIRAFGDGEEALKHLKSNKVDLVFLDIEMPEMDGVTLAHEIDKIKNPPEIVFITAYSNYALEAWKTRAIGYILKPFNKSDIKGILNKYKGLKAINDFQEGSYLKRNEPLEGEEVDRSKDQVKICCFPGFDVFINNKPIAFRSKKAKEILAYLVHNKGQWINVNTLAFIMVGDIEEEKAQNRVRSYLSRLRQELKEAGITEILKQEYGKCSVDTTLFFCDYYKYLEGGFYLFHGEYMNEYSWAEPAKSEMMKGGKLIR